MEIISSNDGLLTNAEVLEVIKDNRTKRDAIISSPGSLVTSTADKIALQNRELIETKTIQYIKGCKASKLSLEALGRCITRIKALQLDLTEGEIIQIANLSPDNDVEYYLIIEECAERLGDEKINIIREIMRSEYQ